MYCCTRLISRDGISVKRAVGSDFQIVMCRCSISTTPLKSRNDPGIGAVETLQAADTIPRVFQMPDEAGELLSFSAFDVDKRVKALIAALWDEGDKPESIKPPMLSIVRDRP
jgi:hypothetical protein